MRGLVNLIRLARPSHWMKNLFVFAALLFSKKVTDPAAIGEAMLAFAAFCLASSSIYALNDVFDRAEDARHPVKRRRPVASGAISPAAASIFAIVLAAGAIAVAVLLPGRFLLAIVAYLVLQLAYGLGLKRVAILDVLIIAVGFVIRAYAGGVAIDVPVTTWLAVCTLTLALFLGFAKRESERVALGSAAAGARPVDWEIYDEKTLEHMMTVSAALAIATYLLYTVSPDVAQGLGAGTVEREGHRWMFLTVLPVIYAVFRFHRHAISGRATGPVEMVRRDPAFVIALAVWVAMVAVLLLVRPGG
jgi:4-hydroxybenzoate polyprenyltransferase